MTSPTYDCQTVQRFAAMGGIYGNVPALEACLQDASLSKLISFESYFCTRGHAFDV